MSSPFDRRPIVVALAGPNGAGKTTFYHSHLEASGLRLVNADLIAGELGMDAYQAANFAAVVRNELVRNRESFIFETVFSDPVGDKLAFLKFAAEQGYATVLCFIGVASPAISEQRVAMRVSQGGHDVPTAKLVARFPRILANLRAAIGQVDHIQIYDNDDLALPYRLVAVDERGRQQQLNPPVPAWLRSVIS